VDVSDTGLVSASTARFRSGIKVWFREPHVSLDGGRFPLT
jgi:hypothetical protein